jgi:hypothetical protein
VYAGSPPGVDDRGTGGWQSDHGAWDGERRIPNL